MPLVVVGATAESRLAVTEKQMQELQRSLTLELDEGQRKDRELASIRADMLLLTEERVRPFSSFYEPAYVHHNIF